MPQPYRRPKPWEKTCTHSGPALRQARPARAISPELVALYEQRADLPVSTFTDLMAQARQRIDILVYAAVFLHEAYPRLNELFTERAA